MPKPAHIAPITPTGFSTPVAEALPAAVQRIAQALQPEKSILFGSYAYGIPTPDSDVDSLVIMETTTSAVPSTPFSFANPVAHFRPSDLTTAGLSAAAAARSRCRRSR